MESGGQPGGKTARDGDVVTLKLEQGGGCWQGLNPVSSLKSEQSVFASGSGTDAQLQPVQGGEPQLRKSTGGGQSR